MITKQCLVVIIASLVANVLGTDPEKSFVRGKYKYELFSSGKLLAEAISACKERGAWLVEIKDKDISDSLKSWSSHDVLIGGKFESNWKWNDGSEMRYTNWATNAPFSNPSVKNCLLMGYVDGKWKNVDCSSSIQRYICQSDISYYGSFQITAFQNEVNHDDARMACSNKESRLVDIKTDALDSYISTIISEDSFTSGKHDGTSWKWGDGTSIDANDARWDTSQPSASTDRYCLMKTQSNGWKSQECSNTARYVCQKDLTSGSCDDQICLNKGSCMISNQRYKCQCTVGYFGTKCEKNVTNISIDKTTFHVKNGGTQIISIDVVSYDGDVNVFANQNFKKGTSGITSNLLAATTEITIGPFTQTADIVEYTIQAVSKQHANTKSGKIIVKITINHCDPNPCKNDANCNDLTASPYFNCACQPAYKGNTCDERVYVENNNCMYHVNHDSIVGLETAISICQNMSGSLAMLKTSSIQDFIEKQIVEKYGVNGETIAFWIGGMKPESTWYWLDGSLMPFTTGNKNWAYSADYEADRTNVILSSYDKKPRTNMGWYSKNNGNYGYICEVPKSDPCVPQNCQNGGTCVFFGCSNVTECQCVAGYTGNKCQKDTFTITTDISNFTSKIGQNISVTINIIGYNKSVRIDVFENSSESTALLIKYNVSNTFVIKIGPFNEQSSGMKYWFLATPMDETEVYYKFTSIYVIVQESSQIQSITPKTLVIPNVNSSTSVLKCIATGLPVPTVYWYKDEHLVTSNSSKSIYQSSEPGRADLFVTNKLKTNFGFYKCHSYNMIDNSTKSSNDTAFLRGKLNLISSSLSENLSLGTVSITCVYQSYPKSEIGWKWIQNNNTTKVETNQIFSIQNFENKTSGFVNTTSKLNINLAEYLGPTTFSCKGSNTYENSSENFVEINQNLVVSRNRVFRFFDFVETKNHSQAQSYCISIGHKLPKITNNETQNVLATAATRLKVDGKTYIGARKQIENGSSIWRWHDRTFLYNQTKHNRWTGKPGFVDGVFQAWQNNSPALEGNCLTIRKENNWQWADSDCAELSRFFCEKNVPGVPLHFETNVDECSSNVTINWTPALGNKGIRHRVDVRELNANATTVFSEDVIPEDERKIFNKKITFLKHLTSYTVTITVCPDMCRYPSTTTKTVTTHPDFDNPVDSANVTQLNETCLIMWKIVVEQGVLGFQITAVSNLVHVESSNYIGKTFNDKRTVNNTARQYHFQSSPNRNYTFIVQSLTCAGPGPIREAFGQCLTATGPPPEVISSVIASRPNMDDTMNITIVFPDDINGPISCLFVIVVYKPSQDSGAKITNTESLEAAMLKADTESLAENDAYIAIAIPRSSINEVINGTMSISMRLGDDAISTCNLTHIQKSLRRKRETSSTTSIRAKNIKLENEATYNYYTLSTTPGDNGIMHFKTSNISHFKKIKYSEPEYTTNSYLHIVIIVVVVIVIFIIILLAFIRMKKRRTGKHIVKETISLEDINAQASSEPAYENITVKSEIETNIPVSNLLDVYKVFEKDRSAKFYDQFEMLKQAAKRLKYPTEIASAVSLKRKNRYKNILPSDLTRVKLHGEGDNDFINACYINGFSKPKKYIATQGPLPSTVVDFWRMIDEQKVKLIVMLAKCIENKKKKCEKYWPNERDSKECGGITILNVKETTHGCYKLRTLKLTKLEEESTVLQMQFLDWPDHGVPLTTTNLIRFCSSAAKHESVGPIVVHCSAGAGRTGAFIAYNNLLEESNSLNSIDVYKCVMALRKQRVDMVQTCDQYMLVHKLILEEHLYGVTDINPNNAKEMGKKRDILCHQFDNLYLLGPMNQIRHGVGEKISLMNRNDDICPYENNHVIITISDEDAENPYLNASTIETYGNKLGLIAAQGPLCNTVEYFWRAILDNNINTIVMLTKCKEEKEQCYQYWPEKEGADMKVGNLTIHLKTEDAKGKVVRRELFIKRKDDEMTIIQYQYKGWKRDECPGDASNIFEIIDKMQSSLRRDKDASVLVHCSDGAGRTGVFCAVLNLIERLKTENKIDVFRTVKDLRDCRPGMVQTLEQYQFCYKVVSEYLAMFSLYVNIDENEQTSEEENPYMNV